MILPSTLGMIVKSAPSAAIVASFSAATRSDVTTLRWWPLAAHTYASDEPVLPAVYSSTVMPGRRSPRRSASSIMANAMRFVGPGRIEPLELDVHIGGAFGHDLVQLHHGGVPDHLESSTGQPSW